MGRFTSRKTVRAIQAATLVASVLTVQFVTAPAAQAAIVVDGAIDDDYTGRFVPIPYGAYTGRIAVVETADAYFVAVEQDKRAKSNMYCEDKKDTPNCYQVFNSLVGSDYISMTWNIAGRTIYVPVDILKADATAPSGYVGKAGNGDGGAITGISPSAVQGRSAMDHNLNNLGWRNFLFSPNFTSQTSHPYIYASQVEVRLDKALGGLANGLDLTRPTVVLHNSPEAPMAPIPPPTIVTTSSPTGATTPGISARDTATITGMGGTPTGTVSFFLCGPTQVTVAGCPNGGTQIGSAVSLVAGSATSTPTTATTALGTYCWRAQYSGDGIYPATSHTNATTECFTVRTPPQVSIVTTSTPTGAAQIPGVTASDTATVTGNLGVPTGTVSFFLCSPSESTAAGCPSGGTQIGSAVNLVAGSATSSPTTATTTVGTYCWRAQYSGDATYPASSHTNATSECFTTVLQPPSIVTQSSPSGTAAPGTSASDTATVSGTLGTPTGTVTFFLCGPSESTAAGCPAGAGTQVGGAIALSSGSATSASTTATTAEGRYCWRAVYNGNATYAGASHTNGVIGSNGECFDVSKVPATIATTSSRTGSGVAPGTAVHDVATLTGSAGTPTGTVTFFLCAPFEVTAAGCPAGTGTQVGSATALVNGTATSATTNATTTIGTYCWRVAYSGDSVYRSGAHTNTTSECFTVGQQSVTIVTQSTPSTNVVPGTFATDTATVSGGVGTPTGTITFFLCGPGVSTPSGCASGGSQVGNAVALVNGSATSPAATATSAEGRYCWRAQYSGDLLYAASSHTNGTTECFDVSKRTPSIQTTASATGIDQDPGVSVSDTAQLSGSAGTPTGTVTFFLCGPAQVTAAGCATGGTQVGPPVTLSAAGSATSASTNATTATGRYCWRAVYSGDAIYAAASHTNTTSECFDVVTSPPGPLEVTMTTTSNPSGTGVLPGASVVDVATVAGDPGAPVPTGTVTFFLCGPSTVSSSGCATGMQIGGPVTLDATGHATSPATASTSEVGRYCWRAVYSGDANYLGKSHTNASSECFTTEKAAPSIHTTPKPLRAKVGDRIHDVASVTGGSAPTGTVTFRLYAPKDDDCTGKPVHVDTVPLVNGKATSGSHRVTEFGRYRWIATYSGDARNAPATHGCQAEVVLVSRVLGSIIPNDDLPVTGLDSTVRWFGLALLALAGAFAPTLLRGYGAEATSGRRRRR